jgi:H+/Cl- antiporter ClcA
MAVNIALAVYLGSRIFPRVGALDWTILASAGTIGALFGTPVAAALIFSQTLSGNNNDIPLWDRLFAPLMAAAAGALTTSLFFHPHFSLPIPHYGQMQIADIFSGAIVAAIAIALGMVAVWCLPRLHRLMHKLRHPVLILGVGGFLLGILGVIGGHITLFKGWMRCSRWHLVRSLAHQTICCSPSSNWRPLWLQQPAASVAGASSPRYLLASHWA